MALPRHARRARWEAPWPRRNFALSRQRHDADRRHLLFDIEDVTASDDNAVVLFTGHGQRDGKTLHNPTALRVRIRDGQAVEFRESVWDVKHVEDFWG